MSVERAGLDAMTNQTVLFIGASSGFGQMIAEQLARVGHTVHASMRDIAGRNAERAEAYADLSDREGIDLRAVEMDVRSQDSVDDAAVRTAPDTSAHIDAA